mgnify:CR=1 FL=1
MSGVACVLFDAVVVRRGEVAMRMSITWLINLWQISAWDVRWTEVWRLSGKNKGNGGRCFSWWAVAVIHCVSKGKQGAEWVCGRV